MMPLDVIGFGALNIDKLFRVNRIAVAEEESFSTSFTETCGGSSANTVVGLSRLGCKCGFIGKVANDREGAMLVEDFRKEGVDTKGVIRSERGRSGSVMGFVDKKGERALYIDSGVNDTIGLREIDAEYASACKLMHMTSFVGKESFRTQKELLERLPEKVRISFDPGALYARMGIKKLRPILRRADVIMPNQSELELITREPDYRKGAKLLLDEGIKIVSVKLGGRGCYVADQKGSHLIAPFKVKVVDTTGAGDAFCAGFLYGLIHDEELVKCGRIGNFAASRSVTEMGARRGLPRVGDLELLG